MKIQIFTCPHSIFFSVFFWFNVLHSVMDLTVITSFCISEFYFNNVLILWCLFAINISLPLQWFSLWDQMFWDAEFDSNSPDVKGGTGETLFQPEQKILSYMFYKCLSMVLLTHSGELRMYAMKGRMWGECAGERREVVIPSPPPSTS